MSEEINNPIDAFHLHLDVCAQCRDNPFGLCAVGASKLKLVGALASGYLIAQNDDPELLEWLSNAHQRGGGFVASLASAGLRADHVNWPIIRPLILQMRNRYPEYEPSDAVKQEIRDRV